MRRLMRGASRWLVRRSGLFDAAFYEAQYPDVAAAGVDPLAHYCDNGWREGRSPGPGMQPVCLADAPMSRHLARWNPVVAWMLVGRLLGWQTACPHERGWACNGKSGKGADIAIVLHEASRTGAPLFALRLARWLRDEGGWTPALILLEDGELRPLLTDEFPCFLMFALAPSARQDCVAAAFDGCCTIYFNSLAALRGWRDLGRLCHDVTVHCHESEASLAQYERYMTMARSHARVITVDAVGMETLARMLDAQPVLIPPAVDVAAGQRARRSAMGGSRQRVVGCGKASYRKGADLFCELVARLLPVVGSDVEFLWIGGAADVDMADLCRRLGIASRVILAGDMADPLPMLASATVFVLPSREDPFPLVALEAASCGVPIVCFDTMAGGVGQWVEAGAGMVVPAFDIPTMAGAVQGMLHDGGLQERLGNFALQVSRQYDIGRIGPEIDSVLRSSMLN